MTVGEAKPARTGASAAIRSALVGTAIVIVATLTTLFVLEGGASLFLSARDVLTARVPALRPSTRADTLVGWVGKPNYHSGNAFGAGIGMSTDDEGRRTAAATGTTSASTPTSFVCSGDSFVLGLGVDDAHPWCAVLSRYFSGAPTFNMGQPDYGVDQSFLWYRRDAGSVAPRAHLFAVTASGLEHAASAVFLGRNKPYLTIQDNRLGVGQPLGRQSALELRGAAMWRTLDELQVMRLIRSRPAFDRAQKTSAEVDARWPVVERMFDELAAIDKAKGATLVLVYLPQGRDRRPSHLDVWRDTLAAYTARAHVPLIDLTPDLRALRPDSADIAFISPMVGAPTPFAGQYSDVGHAWVARTLASRLPAMMNGGASSMPR